MSKMVNKNVTSSNLSIKLFEYLITIENKIMKTTILYLFTFGKLFQNHPNNNITHIFKYKKEIKYKKLYFFVL